MYKRKRSISLSNKNKRARIFVGVANADAIHGTFWKAIGISHLCHLKCSNVIGQPNCLLPILDVSLAGIRRSFVLILPNIGP